MENKKYLDKVIGSLVRGTRIDYENERIIFPFPVSSPPSPYFSLFRFFSLSSSASFLHPFSTYCKNTFGLTEEEIEYVYKKYRDIIKDKISNSEP